MPSECYVDDGEREFPTSDMDTDDLIDGPWLVAKKLVTTTDVMEFLRGYSDECIENTPPYRPTDECLDEFDISGPDELIGYWYAYPTDVDPPELAVNPPRDMYLRPYRDRKLKPGFTKRICPFIVTVGGRRFDEHAPVLVWRKGQFGLIYEADFESLF